MSGDKDGVEAERLFRSALRQVLDFALPPRCAGRGEIVAEVHSFCSGCWTKVEFLGESGCSTSGIPLEATDAEECGACIAEPPRIQRTRSAVAYDELSRSIAIRLKYGREGGAGPDHGALHGSAGPVGGRSGTGPRSASQEPALAARFNQSALVARELARTTGLRSDPHLLRRVKRTPALKVMRLRQRRDVVTGAFRVEKSVDLDGRTVVLVDDVLTTGSTTNACARALQKAGAKRVELVSWARVIKPMQLT